MDARPSVSLAASLDSCVCDTEPPGTVALLRASISHCTAPWLLPIIALMQLLPQRALSPPEVTSLCPLPVGAVCGMGKSPGRP